MTDTTIYAPLTSSVELAWDCLVRTQLASVQSPSQDKSDGLKVSVQGSIDYFKIYPKTIDPVLIDFINTGKVNSYGSVVDCDYIGWLRRATVLYAVTQETAVVFTSKGPQECYLNLNELLPSVLKQLSLNYRLPKNKPLLDLFEGDDLSCDWMVLEWLIHQRVSHE